MEEMEKRGINRIRVERNGFSVELERYTSPPDTREPPPHPPPAHPPEKRSDKSGHLFKSEASPESRRDAEGEPEEGTFVTSPMVGTFYNAASPSDPPFVSVGSKVREESTVCIIEAMKVMNEVKAGVTGTIAQVYIENGRPVEFGSKLFRVTP